MPDLTRQQLANSPATQPPLNPPLSKAATLERRAYQRALRWIGLLVAALAVGGTAIGWFAAGLPGVWGALIGVALAGLCCAATVWSVAHTIGADTTSIMTTVLGTWLVKLVLIIVALAFLRGREFYNPYVLFGVLALGVIGAVIIESYCVHRSRMTYVDTEQRAVNDSGAETP